MTNFDEILANLHNSSILSDDETNKPIVINSRRQFEVPSDYNLILAYAGDVNSQIVTFQLPKFHEGHDLSLCANKKLKWKNMASTAEGISDLVVKSTAENWTAEWEVPPAAMTQAGNLEIAIQLYDILNEQIAFSWNTPAFKEFSIGDSFNEVGVIYNNEKLPARNEVLSINIEGRTLVAPVGYNTTVANYGDIGTSKVFFQTNRYIRGIDLVTAKVCVNVMLNEELTATYYIPNEAKKILFSNGEKIIICWDIPPAVTCGKTPFTGNFAIAFECREVENIEEEGETKEKIIKRWVTSVFSQLKIGPSLLSNDVNSIIERDENALETAINNYFDKYYFVTDANED